MEYTAQQVADGFGVTVVTVHRWANDDKLRFRMANLRKRMFDHAEVMRFAEEHGLTFTPPKKK